MHHCFVHELVRAKALVEICPESSTGIYQKKCTEISPQILALLLSVKTKNLEICTGIPLDISPEFFFCSRDLYRSLPRRFLKYLYRNFFKIISTDCPKITFINFSKNFMKRLLREFFKNFLIYFSRNFTNGSPKSFSRNSHISLGILWIFIQRFIEEYFLRFL